jgi:2,5-dihydroxypyridine 5,6-dioxygenase
MLAERIEGKWIDAFYNTLGKCRVQPGDEVVILSETLSRQVNVHLAELALLRLKAKPFHAVIPSPHFDAPAVIRSTGACFAIQHNSALLAALKRAPLVVDCTVEGLMHAPELPEILGAGSRVFFISNEHPEVLERLQPIDALKEKVLLGREMLMRAKRMHVTSAAGTDLRIDLPGAKMGGTWGVADEPGRLDHWPGGLVACYPVANAVNGVVVLDRGDLNLTFKRYLESPVTLRIENDYAVEVIGESLDADMTRSYLEAWGDRGAYGSAHLGWGMNPKARWDSLMMFDRGDINGVEQRAFAGNFLYSTGANKHAGRYSLGHFDLPMRNCTITLDNDVIVERGKLAPALSLS